MVAPKLRSVCLSGLTLFTMALQSSHGLAQGVKPPIENVENARQIVYGAIARVDDLIQLVFGPNQPHDDRQWPAPQPPQDPNPDFPREGPVPPVLYMTSDDDQIEVDDHLENDRVAGFALQGLGAGLRHLGEFIDQANANYYSPSFGIYWQKVCWKAGLLISATQGGKVSAALPMQGLITPQDFALTEQELMAVRNQFYCN